MAVFAAFFLAFLYFSCGYIINVNSRAASMFEISKLNREVGILKEEIEDLEIKSARMKSMNYLKESSKNLKMEKISFAEFIEITNAVALRK